MFLSKTEMRVWVAHNVLRGLILICDIQYIYFEFFVDFSQYIIK